jgi:hypothetical protein
VISTKSTNRWSQQIPSNRWSLQIPPIGDRGVAVTGSPGIPRYRTAVITVPWQYRDGNNHGNFSVITVRKTDQLLANYEKIVNFSVNWAHLLPTRDHKSNKFAAQPSLQKCLGEIDIHGILMCNYRSSITCKTNETNLIFNFKKWNEANKTDETNLIQWKKRNEYTKPYRKLPKPR